MNAPMDSVFDEALEARAAAFIGDATRLGLKIATAESCTGGLVAGLLTEVAGSSAVVERGFVTYSNEAKHELLGVSTELIQEFGAVSEQVARAMAEGALAHSRADIAVAITGVAGPGGGTPDKPVGLVQFACASRNRPTIAVAKRFGDRGRRNIRRESISVALGLLEDSLRP